MKVILTQSVTNLGKAGEVKNVADGYAVNYLLPKKLASVANTKNIELQEIISAETKRKEKEMIEIQKNLAQKISGLILAISVKAKEGKLFGSVGIKEIKKALEKNGVLVESQQIILPQPIKEIGEKSVIIRFNDGIEAKITLKIAEE